MIHEIPKWNISKFEKFMKSLQRKGIQVEYECLGEDLVNVDGTDYICNVYDVSDNTVYAVPGWEFIGTLEHKENGNIIRKAKEVKVPKRYEQAACECEHCHTNRRRNDTYLVRSTETGDFKQVGKTCLKGYTGLNPAICTFAMSLDAELAKLEMNEDEVILGGYNAFGSYRGYDCDRIKKLAYVSIKNRGYKKNTMENSVGKLIPSTKDETIELYYTNNPKLATDEEIADVDQWVGFLDISHNDYYRNAAIAYAEKYLEPRDLALVISLISCYFRDKAKQAEKAAREEARKLSANASQEAGYLGQVGEKVEFEIASDYQLFINEPYAYGADYTYTHKITDTQGHVILWTTANKLEWNEAGIMKEGLFQPGVAIRATVKAQKEFRGELQTVVTRGKIFGTPEQKPQGTYFNLNDYKF